RVLNKITDRRQHRRDQLGIFDVSGARADVLEQESGLAVNEEDLLDAEQQRIEQDDLAERLAGAERFEPPLQGTSRDAVLERAIQRFNHRREAGRDRLAA